MGIDLEVEVLP